MERHRYAADLLILPRQSDAKTAVWMGDRDPAGDKRRRKPGKQFNPSESQEAAVTQIFERLVKGPPGPRRAWDKIVLLFVRYTFS